MTALTASLVFQTLILATSAQPYPEAYKTADETGKPLLVLVGADWCPGCRVMKNNTLAKMEKEGKLSDVSYAVVNADNDPNVARQVMRGSSIPQLVLFEKTDTGWKRTQITGAVSEREVGAFISRAVEQHVRLARQRSAAKVDVGGGGQ